eukprot:TRINITY_DN11136_c0_g1_i4.p1 TRINITY_DN11136_c0_g1~~TRINITY_DN11136_c0_g1_i4.p1  ORF type:complete len:159 (-),score=43.29 TRINITY_DN11136_c0_g1_i4:385-861(-)
MGIGEEEDYLIQRPDGRFIFGGQRDKDQTNTQTELRKMLKSWKDGTHHVGCELDPHVSEALKKRLVDIIPETKNLKIEYEWAGIQGWTPDRQPLIGPLYSSDHDEFIIAGFCGEGMSKSCGAAKYLVEMMMGLIEEKDYIKSFLPGRFHVENVVSLNA